MKRKVGCTIRLENKTIGEEEFFLSCKNLKVRSPELPGQKNHFRNGESTRILAILWQC